MERCGIAIELSRTEKVGMYIQMLDSLRNTELVAVHEQFFFFAPAGTFDHRSRRRVIQYRPFTLPLFQIGRLKKQHIGRVSLSRSNQRIKISVFCKNARIAEVVRAETFGEKFSAYDDFRKFRKVNAVVGIGDALRLITISVAVDDARIHKIQPFPDHDGAARKTAVLIDFVTGRKRDRQMFPFYKILTAHVSPMHRAPLRGIRVVLKKYMIIVFVEYGTVRVIYPTFLRRNMKFLSLHKITFRIFSARRKRADYFLLNQVKRQHICRIVIFDIFVCRVLRGIFRIRRQTACPGFRFV